MVRYNEVSHQAIYYHIAVSRAVGWNGDFDLGQPLDYTPASRQMMVVLQKAGEG